MAVDRVYLTPTKRRRMTQPRAAKIFRSRNGICFLCKTQIRDGATWTVEHPETLDGGGSDDDADLWPIHEGCKAVKDAVDAAEKGKRDRLVTAGWAGKRRGPPMPGTKASGLRKRMDGTVEKRP